MPAPASYARRQFPGAAADTTIVSGINNTDLSVTLSSATGWPAGAYTGGILIELYNATTGVTVEKVWSTNLTGVTLTIVRAADGTTATSHSAGTGIRPIAGAIDADEANRAVSETIGQVTAAGQILIGDGAASMAALDVKTSGRIIVGNGTTATSVAVSGDATLASTGALTIANDAITAAKIGADQVGTSEIAADAVTSSEIATDAVGTAEIAADAVTSSEIATNAVGSAELADNAVDTAAIAALAVTAAKIANDTITATQIAPNAIAASELAADAVGNSELADDAVDSANYIDGSIDPEHIGPIPTCSVSHSTTTTVNHNTQTALAADTEAWDSGTMHDLVTNNSRITVPIAGIYSVSAVAEFGATSNYTIRSVSLFVDGVQSRLLNRDENDGDGSVPAAFGGAVHLKLTAGQYVETYAFQTNGGGTVRNVQLLSFSVTWLGPAP